MIVTPVNVDLICDLCDRDCYFDFEIVIVIVTLDCYCDHLLVQ